MAPTVFIMSLCGSATFLFTKSDFFSPPTLSCLAVINTETVQAANFKIDHYSGSLHTGTSTLIT